MKLLQIGWGHVRNVEAIVRGCNLFNIEYHYSDYPPPDNQYDIIWAPSFWVNPDQYPTSKFLFGPHFWVFAELSHPFYSQAKPEHASRCVYLTLSDWVTDLHREFIPKENEIIPYAALPFGVEDIPPLVRNEIRYDCLIYCKERHPAIYQFCKEFIHSMGMRYDLVRYGHYRKEDYLYDLQRTRFVVWIGRHESQGFGLEECLGSGIPIYLFDVTSMKEEYANGRFTYENYPTKQLTGTAAPYWDDRCGMKVYSEEEFVMQFETFIKGLPTYKPAEYIKEVLSDEKCFTRMLDALKITVPKVSSKE